MAQISKLIEALTAAEFETLREMSKHHRYASFQLRAHGLLALNAGHKPTIVAAVLQKTAQSVYNWAKWWREDGLAGILNRNKGGAPIKLTAVMLDTAVDCAAKSPLTWR
jgi:transposase